VLSGLGTGLGMLLAAGALRLVASAGAVIPQVRDARIDGPVLLFAAATSLVTGLLFGLAPLQHVVKRNLHGVTRAAAAATTPAAGAQRLRNGLIVAQLALALVLLAGTGLMLRTFWNLQRVDGGFDPTRVVTMSVSLRDATYADEGARRFWTRVSERLAAVPGVESATLTSALPPLSDDFGWGTRIPGYTPVVGGPVPSGPGGAALIDHYLVVGTRYFETLKIGLVEGRLFDAREDATEPKAAIINATMARLIWGDESPIGRQFVATVDNQSHTIVGVVADVKNGGIDKPAGTAVYLPYAQVGTRPSQLRLPYIAVRSAREPASIVADVRRVLHDVDPALPVAQIRTLDDVVSASQSRPRFITLVLTSFAGVSLALAAIGIYGVMAYSVAQRTRELGIRIALGAQARALLRLVLGRALLLTAGGVVLGLAGAVALTRFLAAFLFRVEPTDPATFATVALLLAAIALVASLVPAVRATRLDPITALRSE